MPSDAPARRPRLLPPPPAAPEEMKSILERPLPPGGDDLLAAYAQTGAAAECLYVSTPITTGPRLLAWQRAHPDASSDPFGLDLKREVMAENIRALGPLRSRISRSIPSARVIDPTELDAPGWTQADYHRFWIETIDRYATRLIFADGWQYSTGCAYEFCAAILARIPILDSNLDPMGLAHAADLLSWAAKELAESGLSSRAARAALNLANAQRIVGTPVVEEPSSSRKDDVLARLAAAHNVAIFASFSPGDPRLRHFFSRGTGVTPSTLETAVASLLSESVDGSLNIRTFREEESKSSPFVYGLRSLDEIVDQVREFASAGYYTIVNETINVHDGGVSGVRLGGVVEFAPDTTPRGVEIADVARLPVPMANELLSTVYGFSVEIPGGADERVEFSVHPDRVGTRNTHVCVWESEHVAPFEAEYTVAWPNEFSRMIGDKTFGLLIAHLSGAPVPYTVVVPRRVAPFAFGEHTSTGEWWIRTSPRQQVPGRFTTSYGWRDPFELLAAEDPGGSEISAVLAQEAVAALYSGATLPQKGAPDVVEGATGSGDRFMVGEAAPNDLPENVILTVRAVVQGLSTQLGGSRIEWAFDGRTPWVLQLHRASESSTPTLSPGEALDWVEFDAANGLEALRRLSAELAGRSIGVIVKGRVGITSHVGDILRKARVPARLIVPGETAQ